jgi:DNA polymerase-3 subunit epsilon
LYTVIDVETTGGAARAHKIIEIAIIRFDGHRITDQYHTLINPGVQIPSFIQSLTGIDASMVENAPDFKTVSGRILEITEGQVFVAHNVNFDYGFVKKEFEEIGVSFDRRKLCTVRLARKILPGLPSYGLGSISSYLKIRNNARHRAMGDAEATVKILKHLIKEDKNQFIEYSLNRNSKEATLPPNLSKQTYAALPVSPGVYYFHDEKGKIIYVGKAKSIKSRVSGHFTSESSKQKRLFLNNIHDVTYQLCGNELIALLEESYQIKKHWPKYNSIQKFTPPGFGLYAYDDRNGYSRLCINKVQKGNRPMATFQNFQEARTVIQDLVRKHQLCPKLCGLQRTVAQCHNLASGLCKGACAGMEEWKTYNERVERALQDMTGKISTYAITGQGRTAGEKTVVLVENGTYLGHGFYVGDDQISSIEGLRDRIDPYPDNQDVQRILTMYLKNPKDCKVVDLNVETFIR